MLFAASASSVGEARPRQFAAALAGRARGSWELPAGSAHAASRDRDRCPPRARPPRGVSRLVVEGAWNRKAPPPSVGCGGVARAMPAAAPAPAKTGASLKGRNAPRCARGGRRAGGSATAGAATRAAPRAGWCSAAAAAAADAGAPGNASTWAAAPPLPWPSGDGPPRLCVPPFVSLDHPWCAEWFMSVPLATLGPQRYAGPAGDAAGRVVGGFQC